MAILQSIDLDHGSPERPHYIIRDVVGASIPPSISASKRAIRTHAAHQKLHWYTTGWKRDDHGRPYLQARQTEAGESPGEHKWD